MNKSNRVVYGEVGDKHDIVHPQYKTWGLSGSKSVHLNIPADLLKDLLMRTQEYAKDLSGFMLQYASEINYYQGESLGEKPAILLRFERDNPQNKTLGGEHITFIYEKMTKKLLGFTRMREELTPHVADLTHKDGLAIAIHFLKKEAPDLVQQDIELPILRDIRKDERMEFPQGLPLGSLEVQWMDDHQEFLCINGQKTEIHGMKIKMFMPKHNLWLWVIVGTDHRVLTFERNISWDFDEMQRQTQMWLHDQWLLTQGISLHSVT